MPESALSAPLDWGPWSGTWSAKRLRIKCLSYSDKCMISEGRDVGLRYANFTDLSVEAFSIKFFSTRLVMSRMLEIRRDKWICRYVETPWSSRANTLLTQPRQIARFEGTLCFNFWSHHQFRLCRYRWCCTSRTTVSWMGLATKEKRFT